jgi:hypothetical protein
MEWMMEFYDFRFFLLEFHNTDEVHDFSEGLVYHQPDYFTEKKDMAKVKL